MEEAELKMINEFLKNFFDGSHQEIGDLYLGSIDGIAVYAHPGFIDGKFVVEVIRKRSIKYSLINNKIRNVEENMNMKLAAKEKESIKFSGIKHIRTTFIEKTNWSKPVTTGLFKRFQYVADNGEIKWTKWFPCLCVSKPKVQYKNLKNEYEERY